MGVLFVASLFITKLNREWHVDALLARAGKGGPIVAGAAFAIAWTPCIGPTLGAILGAAAASGSAGRGAFLLAVYSAGLAIPFIATALAFSRMTSAFAVVKRHYQAIVAIGGLILIVTGVLIVTGEFKQLNIEAQNWLKQPRFLKSNALSIVRAGDRSVERSDGGDRLELFADRLGDLEAVVLEVARADDAEAAGADLAVGNDRQAADVSQPRRSTSNGFIRTSAAGKGQLELCWSIALEIASRFFASGEATPG